MKQLSNKHHYVLLAHLHNHGTLLLPFTDQMIRNGDVELQGREEEIRFLKMQLQEEKRALELIQRSVPNKRNLEQEIITLQIQVFLITQSSLSLSLIQLKSFVAPTTADVYDFFYNLFRLTSSKLK